MRNRTLRRLAPLLAIPLATSVSSARADETAAVPTATPRSLEVSASPQLSLEDALALALEANPSLRATLLDVVAARQTARASSASRQPTMVASSSGAYNEQIAGTGQGAVRTRTRSIGHTAGLRYTTDVGTVLSLDVSHTVLWREVTLTPGTSTLVLVGPTHSSQATLSATQPLLRGAGTDAVLGTQRQADARALSAERDAEEATSQLVVDVMSAYWELWYAQRQVAVERSAVAIAERQLADAEHRSSLGTIASADLLRFATERAARAEAASSAGVSERTRALELARLLAVGSARLASASTQVEPPSMPSLPSYAALVDGLERRSPALAALAADVEAARALHASAIDASHPRLDLTGSLGLASLWMNDAYPGLRMPGGRPAVVASAELELELPLVSSMARAQRASATATLDAAELRYAAEAARLETTLASRYAELEGALARIELADQTAALAARAAEAERGRNAIGTSTPTALLEAQQTERSTALDALRARVDAELASARLIHAAGRLLERFDLEVERGEEP